MIYLLDTHTHTHTESWSVSHDDCMSGTLSSICSLSMVITHAYTQACLRQQLKVRALAECCALTFIMHHTCTHCCVRHSAQHITCVCRPSPEQAVAIPSSAICIFGMKPLCNVPLSLFLVQNLARLTGYLCLVFSVACFPSHDQTQLFFVCFLTNCLYTSLEPNNTFNRL